MSQLARRGPHALAPAATTEEARAQLIAARERLVLRLEAVESTVTTVVRAAGWREVVRRHPLLAVGGALLFGYALGNLFSRK
jgi:ElaB/YqjD/DUF883 family membrane-anchored ribosome-binding protein